MDDAFTTMIQNGQRESCESFQAMAMAMALALVVLSVGMSDRDAFFHALFS